MKNILIAITLGSGVFPLSIFAQQVTENQNLTTDSEVVIRNTVTSNVGGRKITVNRIDGENLRDLKQALIERRKLSAASQQSLNATLSKNDSSNYTSMLLSATVVDQKMTLLEWNYGGESYQAWSRVNFNYLAEVTDFSEGDRRFMVMLLVQNLKSELLAANSDYRIPDNLAESDASFVLAKGSSENAAALDCVRALHGFYDSEVEQLKQAYAEKINQPDTKLAQAVKSQEKKEVILNFWKEEPAKDAQGEQKGENQ